MDTYRARLECWIQCLGYPGAAALVAAQFTSSLLQDLLLTLGCLVLGITVGLILAKGFSYSIAPQ